MQNGGFNHVLLYFQWMFLCSYFTGCPFVIRTLNIGLPLGTSIFTKLYSRIVTAHDIYRFWPRLCRFLILRQRIILFRFWLWHHDGCDRSAGDAYSSMAPDPTSVLTEVRDCLYYITKYCRVSSTLNLTDEQYLWFVMTYSNVPQWTFADPWNSEVRSGAWKE